MSEHRDIGRFRPPYASAIARRRRMGIAWRIDRRPSLLKWAKDLAFASLLREPFGPVLQETVVVMPAYLVGP